MLLHGDFPHMYKSQTGGRRGRISSQRSKQSTRCCQHGDKRIERKNRSITKQHSSHQQRTKIPVSKQNIQFLRSLGFKVNSTTTTNNTNNKKTNNNN